MRCKRIRSKKEGTLCKKMHNVLFLTAKGRTARQGKGKKDGGAVRAQKREKEKDSQKRY